jgi:hypothetical protein
MGIDQILTAPIIAGSGAKNNQNCSVELLGKVIYGDMRYGYDLPCLDKAMQAAAVAFQDRLSDAARNSRRWRLLLLRLGQCHLVNNDEFQRRFSLMLAMAVEEFSEEGKALNRQTAEKYGIDIESLPHLKYSPDPEADADTNCMDFFEAALDAWQKLAVDMGEAIVSEMEDEYAQFVEQLDWFALDGSGAE